MKYAGSGLVTLADWVEGVREAPSTSVQISRTTRLEFARRGSGLIERRMLPRTAPPGSQLHADVSEPDFYLGEESVGGVGERRSSVDSYEADDSYESDDAGPIASADVLLSPSFSTPVWPTRLPTRLSEPGPSDAVSYYDADDKVEQTDKMVPTEKRGHGKEVAL